MVKRIYLSSWYVGQKAGWEHLLWQRAKIQFLAPTQWLTTFRNSSSRRSHTLWVLQAPSMYAVYIPACRQNTHPHKVNLKFCFYTVCTCVWVSVRVCTGPCCMHTCTWRCAWPCVLLCRPEADVWGLPVTVHFSFWGQVFCWTHSSPSQLGELPSEPLGLSCVHHQCLHVGAGYSNSVLTLAQQALTQNHLPALTFMVWRLDRSWLVKDNNDTWHSLVMGREASLSKNPYAVTQRLKSCFCCRLLVTWWFEFSVFKTSPPSFS